MNKQQIKKTQNKLETTIRQYVYGVQNPCMVKNYFHQLFVDLVLELPEKQGRLTKRNVDFDTMIEEW